MPALTMRGRYLMREYWSDSDLFLKLDAGQREVYVGLWMLADDDGWLPRDIPAISASIYRFEDRAPREESVTNALGRLSRLGKVTSHRCCLFLPAVARYPRAGKRSTEHHKAHLEHSSRSGVQIGSNGVKRIQTDLNAYTENIQTDLNPSPVPTYSLPDVADARAQGGAPSPAETEFRRRVPKPA